MVLEPNSQHCYFNRNYLRAAYCIAGASDQTEDLRDCICIWMVWLERNVTYSTAQYGVWCVCSKQYTGPRRNDNPINDGVSGISFKHQMCPVSVISYHIIK